MKLNLQGSFFLAQIAARQMAKQGKGGSILFMSSVTGHQAHKNLAAYGMSKAALEMLAKNLVIELSALGITVNCIAPGATLTERTVSETNYAETWARLTPIGKAATVADIANAVSFLISKKLNNTDPSLVIDGWTAIGPSFLNKLYGSHLKPGTQYMIPSFISDSLICFLIPSINYLSPY